MIYNPENPILKIVSVENLSWKGGTFNVRPREYSALAFRIKGTAIINACNSEYYINSNDIMYMPQNMEYTAEYTDTEMLVIHFVTLKSDLKPRVYSFQNVEQIYKLFLNALNFWKNKEPGFDVYALSQLYMILGVILEKKTKSNQPQHFLNAISFINSNYKNSALSIDMICTEAAISEAMLRQLFKKYYQKTPIEYIISLRLEYARGLISSGASIETAAYESGFNDSKYFSRVVKKHFGCTPKELRIYGK